MIQLQGGQFWEDAFAEKEFWVLGKLDDGSFTGVWVKGYHKGRFFRLHEGDQEGFVLLKGEDKPEEWWEWIKCFCRIYFNKLIEEGFLPSEGSE